MGLVKQWQLEEAERKLAEHYRELAKRYPDDDNPEMREELERLLEKDD